MLETRICIGENLYLYVEEVYPDGVRKVKLLGDVYFLTVADINRLKKAG